MAAMRVLGWVRLAGVVALAGASLEGKNVTSKADLAGLGGRARATDHLRGSERAAVKAANPCAACSACVATARAREAGVAEDACAACAMGAKSSGPCTAESGQCQCSSVSEMTTVAPMLPPGPLRAWFSRDLFKEFLPYVDHSPCNGAYFFTHQAFLEAADHFPSFAGSGDQRRDKLELAAFFGQTSHATSGGWPTAPGGPYAWGYCWREEMGCGTCHQYCWADRQYPCVPSHTYHGRGPMQITWNYNYGAFSEAMLGDKNILLADPSKVANDQLISFLSAIWIWMTPRSGMPSCHDAMTGAWQPSPEDSSKGRTPGFGMTTNILDGRSECNKPTGDSVEDRVGFYKRFAKILGESVDEQTLYCNGMEPYQ